MSRFPSDAHLASWGGMCPGQRKSGDNEHCAATRKGSKWLRGTLTSAPKQSFAARAPTARRASSPSRAAAGTPKRPSRPNKILTAAYHVLERGVPYDELGEEFFYRRDTEHAPATAAA
jgi:transposase